jgi:hypothetical protein
MSLEFDGTDDYVDVGTFNMPAVATLSIVAYINPDTIDDKRVIAKSISQAVQDHTFMLGVAGGDDVKFRVRTSTTVTCEGGGGLSTGEWAWVAGVYNGSTAKIYVNAVEKYSVSQSGNLAQQSHPVWIGGNSDGPSSKPFNGHIEEVRLYSKALSVAELQTIAAGGGHDGIDYKLEHRWFLIGKKDVAASGAGSVKDIAGSEHGTPSGPIYRGCRLSPVRGLAG